MMAVIHLTKENYETEVLQSDKPVLIDFWAGWCGPCQMLSPVVDALAEERDDIKVAKLNVDDEELADIVMGFRVMSIPMLVVIKNGEETNRSIGVISREEILALL
jgi:thioredoxin 1